MKLSIMKGAVSSLTLLALLAGCASAPPPEKSGEEVLKEALVNFADVDAYTYNVAFKGDIVDPTGESLKFDFQMGGQMDGIDIADPKMTMKLNVSGSDSIGTKAAAKGEIRMNKDMLYANVMNLEFEALPEEFKEFLGKWWSLPIPPGTFDELGVTLASENDARQEELKKNLENIKLFATPEYKGSDNIMGEKSHHYSVNVDKKGLLDFIKAASEAEGETISAADMAQAERDLDNVEIAGDVWVGSESMVLNQFKGSITLNGGAGEPNGTVSVEFTIGDLNVPFTFEVPADAEEFPMESLLGPMMMMGGGMPADPSMGDSMMDSSMGDGMTEAELEAMMEDFEGGAPIMSPDDFPTPITE